MARTGFLVTFVFAVLAGACGAPPDESVQEQSSALNIPFPIWLGPRGADGALLSVTYDAHGFLQTASATDVNGVPRKLVVLSGYDESSAMPSSAILYYESDLVNPKLTIDVESIPNFGDWIVHTTSASLDFSYVFGANDGTQESIVRWFSTIRSTGSTSSGTGYCDWSWSQCGSVPGLAHWFPNEMKGLAYFDSVLVASLSNASSYTNGVSAAHAHDPFCGAGAGQLTLGYAQSLFAAQETTCSSPSECAVVPLLLAQNGVSWPAVARRSANQCVVPPRPGGPTTLGCYFDKDDKPAKGCFPDTTQIVTITVLPPSN
jgi:hypothetical protein